MAILTNTQYRRIFGEPGEHNLVKIDVPFPLRLSWDLDIIVKRVRCHKLVSDSLYSILLRLQDYYDRATIEELGIDIFGGVYQHRIKRGGKTLSKHSWGAAIDLDPINNQLKWNHTKASFARPEYKKLIDAFYEHGWVSLGVEKDYDWMHFESGFNHKID